MSERASVWQTLWLCRVCTKGSDLVGVKMCKLLYLQTTINEIQQQMNDHYQKNTSLREENLELANKLKGLIEQYELREEVCLSDKFWCFLPLLWYSFG